MKIRIATFNLENLDVTEEEPTLATRIEVLRPMLQRLDAGIICFQEIHGQDTDNGERAHLALQQLLADTQYENYNISTTTLASGDMIQRERNLVTISQFPIEEDFQIKGELLPMPHYRAITETPQQDAEQIRIERPFLYSRININGEMFHIINLHLKSRVPTRIDGQSFGAWYDTKWKTAAGWAEGYFISSMKRVGQSLEIRLFIDKLFDDDPDAKVIVCGDFNAHPDEVPVQAICGGVENTGNFDLRNRELVPCENTIPESSRYTYLHHGNKRLLDHMLISRNLMRHYRHAEIHNELLHDESIAWALDVKYPESDHAPFVVSFDV